MSAHPGTILVVDGATGQTLRTLSAAEVPAAVAFEEVEGAAVPVVRVVVFEEGQRRVLRAYAADGRVLRSTVAERGP